MKMTAWCQTAIPTDWASNSRFFTNIGSDLDYQEICQVDRFGSLCCSGAVFDPVFCDG